MTECPRPTETPADCPLCGVKPAEDCPLAAPTPEWLRGTPVTAGTTGVCSVDDEECQSCQ